MKHLEQLLKHIEMRCRIASPIIKETFWQNLHDHTPLEKLASIPALYAFTGDHPVGLHVKHSCISGSFLLGNVNISRSIVYKSDIRGDEFKKAGDAVTIFDDAVMLHEDEAAKIRDSILLNVLVHNHSHDPTLLEDFSIKNSAAYEHANIHGSPINGVVMMPFSTIDLTSATHSIIGAYSYVQTGELRDTIVDSGAIIIRFNDDFNFYYLFPYHVVEKYLGKPENFYQNGVFSNFVKEKEAELEDIIINGGRMRLESVPSSSHVSYYSYIHGENTIGENVFVSQNAYLDNAYLGKGANVQENCFIVNSTLKGFNATAHGAKIINAEIGTNCFSGFNSFIRGSEKGKITTGSGCIIMPHTIIDAVEPIEIPDRSIVWGFIEKQADLSETSITVDELRKNGEFGKNRNVEFEGDGYLFSETLENRVKHILESNGAFYDGKKNMGHAQLSRDMAASRLNAYPSGPNKGLFPNILIDPEL